MKLRDGVFGGVMATTICVGSPGVAAILGDDASAAPAAEVNPAIMEEAGFNKDGISIAFACARNVQGEGYAIVRKDDPDVKAGEIRMTTPISGTLPEDSLDLTRHSKTGAFYCYNGEEQAWLFKNLEFNAPDGPQN